MITAQEDSLVEALYPTTRDWNAEANQELISFVNNVESNAKNGSHVGSYYISNMGRGLKHGEYITVLMSKITAAYPQGIFTLTSNNSLSYNFNSYLA